MNKTYLGLAILFAIVLGYAIGFSQTRHEYNALVHDYNQIANRRLAHKMYGTGNWYCGKMVVSCNEDGYLNMEGNLPEASTEPQ